MSAADFAKMASALGLSHTGMADALGVDVRRVRAYSSGRRDVPRVVALAVGALVLEPKVIELTAALGEAAGLLRGMKG